MVDLILVKYASLFHGTSEVIHVGTTKFEAPHSGTGLEADNAVECECLLQPFFCVHQGSTDCLIHFFCPQGTVQMHPFVHIIVQQPGPKKLIIKGTVETWPLETKLIKSLS